MKKMYILLMLISASIQFVEAQFVFPSTEQKPVWEVVPNQLHSELYYELLIQVEKDTILCGENYSKVIATYKHNNPDTLVFGFYRQAESKVLFRLFGESCQSFDEYLIYDFEAEIGDTITVGWNQIAIVTAIENLKLGNVERRAIGVQYYQQEFTSPIAEEWWIEGIGGSKYPFLQPFCSLYSCYESSYVSCMRAMDKVLLSVGNESCQYDTIAQSVFPTYGDKPVWCVEESIFGRPYETYRIELKADTFICGKIYTPVWEHNRPLLGGGFTSGVTGYIRQEGQRVYHTYQGCAEEILLYDFSLQKGDTIYYSQQYKPQFGIISKIDTIEYGGVLRKTMTVDYPQLFPFPMLPIQRIWIEGIGDTFHPFNSVGCLAGNCEFNARLACFSANNGILYGNCTEACGIDSVQQDNNVFPTYEDKPVWCVNKYGLLISNADYSIELEPDTILCGKKYNPVRVNNEPSYGTTFTGRIGYTRTEGKKVFFRSGECNTSEILVYDFSLQVGDTIRHFQESTSNFGIISKIDTLIYNGVLRKTLTVNYPLFRDPFPTLLAQRIWIEGIGDLVHPFTSSGCIKGNCEHETGLICFSANRNILYGNCTAACGIDSLTSADDIFLNKNQLRLLNNPVALNQLLHITSNLQESTEGQLYIYNALGQVLFSQKLRLAFAGERLPLSWAPSAPGVYWLAWQSEGGERQTVQFVVQ